MSTTSSTVRGTRGAAATAHPAATRAALTILEAGGTAVMPHAAGLGGDVLALVRSPDGAVVAVNGVGASPAREPATWDNEGGSSVTVPGLVSGWEALHRNGGRLPLPVVLEPAVRLAAGRPVDPALTAVVSAHRHRLERYGAASWDLLHLEPGAPWRQPELAALLERIARTGSAAFYGGPAAQAIEAAVRATGGSLSTADLAAHRTVLTEPVRVPWGGGSLLVQPPPSQGILLAMAASWLDRQEALPAVPLDHLLVELVDAVFAHRSDVVVRGSDLLRVPIDPDLATASRRGGARPYLHTAGVAVADADGVVVSSLVSVFDDFGSAVFVPELGIVLANRAAGFTTGANAPGPARYPVHTLAPAMVLSPDGSTTGFATPGADGQVQTLLQVLAALRYTDCSLTDALDRARWRSEGGLLLLEEGHDAEPLLAARGHEVVVRPRGDDVFGAVVVAGVDGSGPHAAADSRRGASAAAS